jgi:hypothetical protein
MALDLGLLIYSDTSMISKLSILEEGTEWASLTDVAADIVDCVLVGLPRDISNLPKSTYDTMPCTILEVESSKCMEPRDGIKASFHGAIEVSERLLFVLMCYTVSTYPEERIDSDMDRALRR